MKYGIIVSSFNPEITQPMLAECLKGFKEQKIKPDVIQVPGAVEIPLTLQTYIRKNKPAAVIALGCVIKGDTDHYDIVCKMASDGILKVMLETQTPVVFEVLMTDTVAKAKKRIKKGYHAAYTATEMAKLIRSVS